MKKPHIVVSGTPETNEDLAKFVRLEQNRGLCGEATEIEGRGLTSICRRAAGHEPPHGWELQMDAGLTL